MTRDRIIYDPSTGRTIGVVEDAGIRSENREMRANGTMWRHRLVLTIAFVVIPGIVFIPNLAGNERFIVESILALIWVALMIATFF